MASPHPITVTELRAALDYAAETGVFTWRHRSDRSRAWNARYALNRAGGAWTVPKTKRLYWRIVVGKRLYLAHRLAWLFVHGEWPRHMIDHINGNGLDNRIANLRLATCAQNAANAKAHRDNGTGYKGVSFDRERKKFAANICRHGKQKHLGRYDTPEEAHAAYCAAAEELFGEFARER